MIPQDDESGNFTLQMEDLPKGPTEEEEEELESRRGKKDKEKETEEEKTEPVDVLI